MTAGELWLIILGFIFALVFFVIMAITVKEIAKYDGKKNRDKCNQDKPCKGCICGRGIGTGNLL